MNTSDSGWFPKVEIWSCRRTVSVTVGIALVGAAVFIGGTLLAAERPSKPAASTVPVPSTPQDDSLIDGGDSRIAGGIGACCDAGSGQCADGVSAATCAAQGNNFQGGGSQCAACNGGPNMGGACRTCSNAPTTFCTGAAGECPGGICQMDTSKCRTCVGGTNPGTPCTGNAQCLGGTCPPLGNTCSTGLVGNSCVVNADCNLTGTCDLANQSCSAGNVGQPCTSDAQCNVAGTCVPVTCEAIVSCNLGACCDPGAGTCTETAGPPPCVAGGGNFQGFGTNCASVNCSGTNDVPAGSDMFVTPPGCITFVDLGDPDATPIPGGFFGPGSDPFLGVICLQGAPLLCTVGDSRCKGADTIVERLADCNLPFPPAPPPCMVPIQIRALHLASENPITVTFNNDPSQFSEYDVEVFLSEHCEQRIGSMTINHEFPNGGTFTSQFSVSVKLVFTKVGPGPGTQTAILDPPGECVGGPTPGASCSTDADCVPGGICACFRTTDELFTGPTPQNPFAPPGNWSHAAPPATYTFLSVPAGDADHDGDGVIVEAGSHFPATTNNFQAGVFCPDLNSPMECFKDVETPEEADWAAHGILPHTDNNAPPPGKKCIYHVTCREGSNCSACPVSPVPPDTLCQTIDCANVDDCPVLPPTTCGGGNCCVAFKGVDCRVPTTEPVCPAGNDCTCATDCTPLPPNDTDKVLDYACNCYDRLGITVDQLMSAGWWEGINCKTNATQLYTTEKCPKPNDFTANVDQPDCKIRDININGVANSNAAADFPADCDRTAWLSDECYGNSYIRRWDIDATDGGKVTVALLCRHRTIWSDAPTDFDDIAMIMHNNKSGQTCWFQSPSGALHQDLDGTMVPAPHATAAQYDPTTGTGLWYKPSDAASVNCIECHDNGPWMNSRWMFNSGIELIDGFQPYINKGHSFSNWKEPNFITVDSAGIKAPPPPTPVQPNPKDYRKKSCTSCHGIESGEAGGDEGSFAKWIKYTVGSTVQLVDPTMGIQNVDYPPKSNATGRDFPIAYWMSPKNEPNWHDVYAADAANWGTLYQKHVHALLLCAETKGKKSIRKCLGGTQANMPCTKNADCPGGECPVATLCEIRKKTTIPHSDVSVAAALTPGVHLYADTNNDGIWDHDIVASADSGAPPNIVPVSTGTPLAVGWSADADHPNCYIGTTFPAGVAVNGTSTATNWLLSDSPQTIGALTVPGDYYFHIDCNDDAYGQIYASLTFQVPGQSPTVLYVQGIVDGVGTMTFNYPTPGQTHADIPVAPSSDVKIGWVAFNVVAGSCSLSETFDPSGPSPRTFAEESGFESVTLYPMTDQNYTLTCTGDDGQDHSVNVTLRVVIAPTPVWNSSMLSPDRTTRALRFTVQPPATATGTAGQSAIKMTMIDLQNPNPPNLPANPPPDFSAFESATCTAVGETNGCARWVGKPGTFLESQDIPGLGNYRAARLQCTPFYHDWTKEGPIAVVGAEIAPSSEYSIQAYSESCRGAETGCTNVSAPVQMFTRRSGDVELPLNPPSTSTQPDVTDVAQLVNKFKNLSGAPIKAIAQLQPNLPELNADINALDIVAVVDAVKQRAYAFGGPCPCPSTVTCLSTGCSSPTPCVTAFGSGATCVKTCTGPGPLAGDPCVSNSHCVGSGTCGPGFCRDRCGRCSP